MDNMTIIKLKADAYDIRSEILLLEEKINDLKKKEFQIINKLSANLSQDIKKERNEKDQQTMIKEQKIMEKRMQKMKGRQGVINEPREDD